MKKISTLALIFGLAFLAACSDDNSKSNNTNNTTNNTSNTNNTNNTNSGNNNTNNPAGACDNPADAAIIDNPDVDQDAITGECSRSCFTATAFAECVAQCVNEQVGLSEACSACYGQTAECGKNNCLMDCMGGESPECEACLDTNCHPSFVECAGVEGR
jgi:hypothetical protein